MSKSKNFTIKYVQYYYSEIVGLQKGTIRSLRVYLIKSNELTNSKNNYKVNFQKILFAIFLL